MMMNHTQKLLSIRPTLEIEPTDESEIANFQSNTLRPILKMQNEIILAIFKDYIQEIKFDFSKVSPTKQKDFIEHAFAKQASLKFLLIGLIVGHFTSEEYTFYQIHKQELAKRIVRFLAKRIFDGLKK